MRTGENTKDAIGKISVVIKSAENIYNTGSGTSYNSTSIAKQLFFKYAKIKVEPIMVSYSFCQFREKFCFNCCFIKWRKCECFRCSNNCKKKQNCKVFSIVNLLHHREIKARGVKVSGISDKQSEIYDYWIQIPTTDSNSFPIIEIIAIQLLAYFAIVEKYTDSDYPRNLAKISHYEANSL